MRFVIGPMLLAAACGHDAPPATTDASAVTTSPDAPASDVASLGVVDNVRDAQCPQGTPQGATCKRITVIGCPGIETEALDAIVAILLPAGEPNGTVSHWKGGGGEGLLVLGSAELQAAGFRQVFVSWTDDWEQTQSHGIKTAACRPATVLAWIFDDPGLHAGSRSTAFCAAGKSGGSAQLGYALADYGMADKLDYVTERAGPPFARIDLGCDGDAPAMATVCGDPVSMQLPDKVTAWENMTVACGSHAVPAEELARWKDDSIAVGGTFDYPHTQVDFFDCTYNAPAVTGMSQLYYQQVEQAEGGTSRTSYQCYTQADHCRGEDLGDGDPIAIQKMIDGCRPRHL